MTQHTGRYKLNSCWTHTQNTVFMYIHININTVFIYILQVGYKLTIDLPQGITGMEDLDVEVQV